MTSTEIRDALAQATAYLTAHPAEAHYTHSPATAALESGLAVTVQGPNGTSVLTDMPKSVGGGDAALPRLATPGRPGQLPGNADRDARCATRYRSRSYRGRGSIVSRTDCLLRIHLVNS